MPIQTSENTIRDYVEMQARVAITKHLGGFAASNALTKQNNLACLL